MSHRGARPLLAIAAAAVLLPGCSRRAIDADFTSLDLSVTFSTALGIDAVVVDVFDADGESALMNARKEVEAGAMDPQTEALTILLPAELRGQRARVAVGGLREELLVASGETFVTLLLGDAVTASVALSAPSVCGNGQLEATEDCDDAGEADGDGCSVLCEVEEGFICIGAPSSCFAEVRTAAVDASATCPGNGTHASPFCRLADAVATTWAQTILLRAGTYDGGLLIDRVVDIIGERGAVISSRLVPVLELSADPVVLEDLEVRGEVSQGGGILISTGGAVLGKRLVVGPGVDVGVALEPGGMLELVDSVVANNRGGGVHLNSLDGFVLWNALIEDNGRADSDVGGIRIDAGSATSVIANVTIRGNQARTSTVAGLDCEARALVLNTIIWDNGSGTPAALTDCDLRYCDVGPLSTSSVSLTSDNFSEDPLLDAEGRLTADSPCIDRGDPDSVSEGLAPPADRDGEPRHGRIDVGADEF